MTTNSLFAVGATQSEIDKAWDDALEFLLTHSEHSGYGYQGVPFVCFDANVAMLTAPSRDHLKLRIEHWKKLAKAYREGTVFPKDPRLNDGGYAYYQITAHALAVTTAAITARAS